MTELDDGRLAGFIEERLDAWGLQAGADGGAGEEAIHALARAIERTWDLVIPHRLLEEVRDRAELVEACVSRVRRHLRLRARRRPLPATARLRVRIEPPHGRGARGLTRSGTMTAYDAEELLDGALRWGPGARLDVVLPDGDDAAMVEALVERARGHADGALEISVRRSSAAR